MKKNIVIKMLALTCLMTIALVGCKAKDKDNINAGSANNDGTVNGTTDDITSDTVIVTDVKGEVEIPANPTRIVDLSGNSDILSILGYKVVGTANSDAYDYTKFPTYLEDILSGAEILGYSMQDTMDVEAVMNVEPDLIIISTVQEKMYDQLNEIAPTVMISLEALNWKDDIMTIAQVFDKEEIATTWLNEYEEKGTTAGDEIKANYGEDKSYLSFLASGGQFYVFGGAGFGSVLYQDMGLAVPAGLPGQNDIGLPVVTYEGLAAIEADYIIVMATPEDLTELENNAIWNNLKAVKEGNVVVLESSPYFNQGYSPIGRQMLLDEIAVMLDETKK